MRSLKNIRTVRSKAFHSCRHESLQLYAFVVPNTIHLRLHAPGDLGKFRLPAGVKHRLTELLDRQDHGTPLNAAERKEAEGLVDMAEMLSLLKLRAARTPAATA